MCAVYIFICVISQQQTKINVFVGTSGTKKGTNSGNNNTSVTLCACNITLNSVSTALRKKDHKGVLQPLSTWEVAQEVGDMNSYLDLHWSPMRGVWKRYTEGAKGGLDPWAEKGIQKPQSWTRSSRHNCHSPRIPASGSNGVHAAAGNREIQKKTAVRPKRLNPEFLK